MNAALDHAIALHRSGDLVKAETAYRDLLKENPAAPDTLALLAILLSARAQYAEALDLIEQAIRHDPHSGLFQFYLGNILMAMKDADKAAAAFERAAELQPGMAQAHYNLGNALRAQGSLERAGAAYAQAAALDPALLEAQNNLALIHEKLGRLPDAVAALRQLTDAHPAYAEGWLNLGKLSEQMGDYAPAHDATRQAIALQPENPGAWLTLGVILTHLDRHQEALPAYQKAIELAPNFIDAWDNLGQTHQLLGEIEAAEKAFHKAIELSGQAIVDEDCRIPAESEYGNRHWHLALLELLQGHYRRGFARYRARFAELPHLKRPKSSEPLWQGHDLKDKTILIGDEQGYGDTLMFCRYLPLLKAKGARVIFLVQPALMPLFAGWAGADLVLARGTAAPIPRHDYHASIFDPPIWLETTAENIPAAIPYLPRPEPTAKTRLESGPNPKIGLVWAGQSSAQQEAKRTIQLAKRSIPLALLNDLLNTPNVQFFSLTRDLRPGDAAIMARTSTLTDLAPRIENFADTAAFLAQLDLVITCDTSTAHLAGGMGIRTWTLLPFAPDWRWLLHRNDSPWYPGMRLFRQKQAGDWAAVIEDVKTALPQALRTAVA